MANLFTKSTEDTDDFENIEYVHPKDIGSIEFTAEERKMLRRIEFTESNLLTAAGVWLVPFLFSSFAILNYGPDESSLVLFFVSLISIITALTLKLNPDYTSSGRGTVIKKEIIMQEVVPNRKHTYRKYFSMPIETDKQTELQDFYYLTVKLENGKYVRYVNCLAEDYENIFTGDSVLVICRGFDEIRGYRYE